MAPTPLAEDLAVADADEDDLYAAMDWLLERQGTIEKKLATRHLGEGSLVLYDFAARATSRGRPVRWPSSGTIATARRASCR